MSERKAPCPACKQPVVVTLSGDTGQTVATCSSCGERFVVATRKHAESGRMRVPLREQAEPVAPAAPPPEEARRPCPFCAEPILVSARKCKHCHEVLDGSGSRPERRSGELSAPAQGSGGNVLAALCSFFLPGLGQLVQGRLGAAIGFALLAVVLWVFLLGWLVHLLAVLDAATFSPRPRSSASSSVAAPTASRSRAARPPPAPWPRRPGAHWRDRTRPGSWAARRPRAGPRPPSPRRPRRRARPPAPRRRPPGRAAGARVPWRQDTGRAALSGGAPSGGARAAPCAGGSRRPARRRRPAARGGARP